MVAAVINDMLHGLPERIAVDAELESLVFQHAVQVALRETTSERQKARLKFQPALLQTGDIGVLGDVRKGRGGAALKAFEPNPFGAEDVAQCIADGREAGVHGFGELLGSERGGSAYRAAVGPGVEVV